MSASFWARLGLVVLVLGSPRLAAASDLEDAAALAQKVADEHRSDAHRARYTLLFPELKSVPRAGNVHIEARTGRFESLEAATTLEVGDGFARIVVERRAHVPTFVARAANKRDEGAYLEASLTPSQGHVALLACALLAAVQEKPRGTIEGPDAKTPDVSIETDADTDAWPRLALDVDGHPAKRRGAYAELARRVLEQVAARAGLARPADTTSAGARLERELTDSDAAPRAAFLLGELGCAAAAPALSKLTFAEARDASIKLAALAGHPPTPALEDASATGSWDVRSWARERLEADAATRGQWPWAVLEHEPAASVADEALAEALRAVSRPTTDARQARVLHLLEDERDSVRVEAAGALLRWDDVPRAREVLVAVVRDEKADPDAREDAVARLASVLAPAELARAFAPVLTSPTASTVVRAQVVRALDHASCVTSAGALAETLEAELRRENPDADARDLRVALVQALSSLASVPTPTGTAALEAALSSLSAAAAVDPDDELRALAIHAIGALPGENGQHGVRAALEAEKSRKALSGPALRAAEIENLIVESKDAAARMEALADAACDAPLRATLERVVVAARDSQCRSILVSRLRARGAAGEPILEAIEKK